MKGWGMSDDNRSDNAQRERLRISNELIRQEREHCIDQLRRREAAEAAVIAFARELATVRGRGAEAAFHGQQQDPAPDIQPIADRLRDAVRALQLAGRFFVLEDMDPDATFNHYSRQSPFDGFSQEHARPAFDYALRRLHEAAKDDRIDLLQMVKDVLFDRSVRPAAQWFQMLLSMVQGELRYEPKSKQAAASASLGHAGAAGREADEPKPAPKRSTERGEARTKLIAALTQHHQYNEGGCLNQEPVGVNELARAAEVAPSTASVFFDREFRGHDKYKALSRDVSRLAAALKLLNGEYAPHDLYGRRPPSDDDRDDE
jgi:hypothetical protein